MAPTPDLSSDNQLRPRALGSLRLTIGPPSGSALVSRKFVRLGLILCPDLPVFSVWIGFDGLWRDPARRVGGLRGRGYAATAERFQAFPTGRRARHLPGQPAAFGARSSMLRRDSWWSTRRVDSGVRCGRTIEGLRLRGHNGREEFSRK